jgi:hypothetical protein
VHAPVSDDDLVASVNGEPIAVAELARAIDHVRAGVTAPGSRPFDAIKKAALDDAVRTKLEQVRMREQGQVTDVSYRGFRTRWQQENARRREAMQRGEPVYGPVEYGEQDYFEYSLDNGVIALKEHLPGLAPTESELHHDYDALRESMFRRGQRRTIELIRTIVPPAAASAQPQAARASLEAIASRLSAGKTLDSATARAAGVTVSRISLGGRRPLGFEQPLEPEVARAASAVPAGASSDVLDTGHGLVIVRCIAAEDLGYASFEDARGQLVVRHIDEAFEARVRSRIASADVHVRSDVYDQVAVH